MTAAPSPGFWTRASRLGLGGAVGFWVTNFAISLTPVAAEYRSALRIPYLPMLGEALLAGLILGLGVSFFLLRFYDNLPTTSPVLKAVLLSIIALIAATLLFEVPPRFLMTTNTELRYLLISIGINALRFLALGVAIGYLHSRIVGPKRLTAHHNDPKKPRS